MLAKITEIIQIKNHQIICRFEWNKKMENRLIDFSFLLQKWQPESQNPISELFDVNKFRKVSLDNTQNTLVWEHILIPHFNFSEGLIKSPLSFSPEMLYNESMKLPLDLSLTQVPKTIEDFRILAKNKETLKEFQRQIIWTFTKYHAFINEKVNGFNAWAFIKHNFEESKKVIFVVKSGKISPSHIRQFRGTFEREKAAIGIFISLEMPTKAMYEECREAGLYFNEYSGKHFDRLQMVTVQDICEGKTLDSQLILDVLKSATRKKQDLTGRIFE